MKIIELIGSGSTLIAAESEGRLCYGMELDPRYCDMIIARWEKATSKKAVLHGRKKTETDLSKAA